MVMFAAGLREGERLPSVTSLGEGDRAGTGAGAGPPGQSPPSRHLSALLGPASA